MTLTGVPANAQNLIVNATVMRSPFVILVTFQEQLVSGPSDGYSVKFVFKVPVESNP